MASVNELETKILSSKYNFIITYLRYIENEFLENISKKYHEKGNFIHIEYSIPFKDVCKFEIGFRTTENMRRVNFFIGEYGGALMQYEEINDSDDEQAVLATIEAFLTSEVVEEKMYCNEKLKEVTYQCSEIKYPGSEILLKFNPVSKPRLFCFHKRTEEIFYQSWLRNKNRD